MNTGLARRCHALLEPISQAAFFSAEATAAFAALGLDPMQGYLCSRAAPMGLVDASVVAAVFYSFSPELVRRQLRWDIATPETVLAARVDAAGELMRRLGDGVALGDALAVLRDVVSACRFDGRPLAAAHAAIAWPDDELTAVWLAATTLREYRGDGHVAVLASHGIDGATALVLDAAYAGKSSGYVAFREFEDEEIRRGADALRARSFLDGDGALTEGGAKFREMIEIDTDRLVAPAFEAAGAATLDRAAEALLPLVRRIVSEKAVPGAARALFARAFPG